MFGKTDMLNELMRMQLFKIEAAAKAAEKAIVELVEALKRHADSSGDNRLAYSADNAKDLKNYSQHIGNVGKSAKEYRLQIAKR